MSLIARRRSIVSAAGGFVPTDISGCVLWLDASDSATITSDVNGVSQWSDKSGQENNVLQSDNVRKPTVSGNSLSFDQDFMESINDELILTDRSIFVVASVAATADGALAVFDFSDNAQTNSGTSLFKYTQTVDPVSILYRPRGGTGTDITTSISADTIFLATCFAESGVTASLRINGSLIDNSAISTLDSNKIVIGGLNVLTYYAMIGTISEVLTYNTVLTQSDYETVENYLNSKWSIY